MKNWRGPLGWGARWQLILSLALWALGAVVSQAMAESLAWSLEKKSSVGQQRSLTGQMAEMPADLIYPLAINQSAFQQRSGLSLPLPSGRIMPVKTTWQIGQVGTDYVEMHALRDLRFRSGDETGASAPVGHGALTVSPHGIFGELHTDEGWFEVTTDRTGTWMVRLDDHRIDLTHQCALEDPAVASQLGASLSEPGSSNATNAEPRNLAVPQNTVHQIDVLMLYAEDMEVRYPGELLNARLGHYFNVANQALANTEIPGVILRMVGADKTSYEPPPSTFDNGSAVFAMRTAVDPQTNDPTTIDPAFANLANRRTEVGADIISLMWAANIETRGSCGVAYLGPIPSLSNTNPQSNPATGVNVINDGFSNWSVCQVSVFAHEIGHNLGLAHQAFTNSSVDTYHYAMVVDTVFTTIMRSFGSADQNRYLSMRAFSNPDMNCAGQPCGREPSDTAAGANAKAVIDVTAPLVAAYMAPKDNEVLTPFVKATPDSDGDGISDWDDPTPFGVFPTAVENPWVARRTISGSDRADFDLLVSGLDDRVYGWRLGNDLQAKSLGALIEAEPAGFPDLRPAFTEFSSIAVRPDGLLFALSGGSVKTYSRFSGEEISTFRGPRYSTGTTDLLRDGFPRALEISGDGSVLVVLNDRVISFFDPNDPAKNGEIYFNRSNIEGATPNWRDVAVSTDGTLVAAIQDFPQPTIQFYQFGLDPNTPSQSIYQHDLTRAMSLVAEPRALAMDIDSSNAEVTLFVSDDATQKIYKRLDSDASGVETQVLIDGSVATNDRALMTNIRDLAIGPDGDLYVLDQGSRSVLRFNKDGQFVAYVVGPDAVELDRAERMTFTRGLLGNEIFRDQFKVQP